MLLNRNDQRARRNARRAGYVALKSRSKNSLVNRGGFLLIDANSGFPIAEFHHDMSADEVIDFCK